jgi:RNA-binding protein Musashi
VKEATPRGAQHRPGGRNQADGEQETAAIVPPDTTNFGGATMNSFNPAQMAQLYSRMMQNMGMGMNMGGMGGMGGMPMGGMGMGGIGSMGGMMNPMMMNGAAMGMGGMNMPVGMMNPMAMAGYGMGGMGMNATRPGIQPGAAATRGGRGGIVGGTGGPSRMVNRGANNFHPYAR